MVFQYSIQISLAFKWRHFYISTQKIGPNAKFGITKTNAKISELQMCLESLWATKSRCIIPTQQKLEQIIRKQSRDWNEGKSALSVRKLKCTKRCYCWCEKIIKIENTVTQPGSITSKTNLKNYHQIQFSQKLLTDHSPWLYNSTLTQMIKHRTIKLIEEIE